MMHTEAMLATDDILTLGAIILTVGMVAGKISKFLKIPDVVMFLVVGIILGPAFLNVVSVEGYPVGNQLILTFGSAFILFEGGREVKIGVLNKVKITVGLLATVGVLLTSVLIGIVSMYIFDIPFIYAWLLGSVIASTDPAALIPIFKTTPLPSRIKQTVISESAFTDVIGTILVFSIIATIQTGSFSLADSAQKLLIMALGGLGIGGMMGLILTVTISDSKYGIFHEYAPVLAIVSVIIGFVYAESIGGSGYMAAFIIGLICGNRQRLNLWIPEPDFLSQLHVSETLGFVLRMAIFVLLGTHVNFQVLGLYWKFAFIIVLFFMLITRPVTVLLCATPDRQAKWRPAELAFFMWVRETGVIPAALSGMIVSMRLPYSELISSVVFMAILFTLGIQASTTGLVARKLNLLEVCEIQEMPDISDLPEPEPQT